MTLSAGTRLGPYELLAPIGAGGMGEVYRAKDTRLDRTVAVKVLSSHLSSSPDSRQRFEREARTISQLSHPHICALYDVGREGETEYLVMEYLEGETLSDRLLKGPLSFDQVLRYGIEIADALDKAHRQGIVHRDLKPGNVMLTKSGVKLLDFGLAKAIAPAGRSSGSSLTALPTQAGSNLTQEGTILGTFQYMAPEQLEGKEADARTDIFAFGCVLYEMATGQKAFSGKSQASLISSIMGTQPPAVSAVAPMTPPAFDRVVKTCLVKDPDDLWQTAHDVMLELKWMVFAAKDSAGDVSLWVHSLDSPQPAQILDGTRDAYDPFWSPDGRFVGYGGDGLFKFEVPSGPPQKIAEMADGRGCSWNRDNVVLFEKSGASPLFRVSASGGPVEQVTRLDKSRGETGHWRPQFLPDGRHFLYLARCEPSQNSGIFVGSLDSKEAKRVLDVDVPASFAQPGYLLFIRKSVLLAQPFDPKALRVTGEPVVVGRDVQYVATWGSSAYSTSQSGVLAYQGASPAARQLVWFDRSGTKISTLGPDGEYADDPRISPDGTRVAIRRLDPTTRSADIWIFDVSRGIGSRFTFDPARESNPVWSADGKRLYFSSNKAGIGDLYEKPVSGTGSEKLLLKSDLWKEPLDVTPDGRWLLYRVRDPKSETDLWLLSLTGDGKVTPLIATPFRDDEGRFSPDGRWLAYDSNETGKRPRAPTSVGTVSAS